MNNRMRQIHRIVHALYHRKLIVTAIIHEKPARMIDILTSQLPIYRAMYGRKLEVLDT